MTDNQQQGKPQEQGSKEEILKKYLSKSNYSHPLLAHELKLVYEAMEEYKNTPSGPERSLEEMASMQWIIAADRNPESEDTRWMEFDGVKTSGRFFKERGEGDDHFYYLDNGPIVRTNKFHLLKWLDESAPLLSTQQGEDATEIIKGLKDIINHFGTIEEHRMYAVAQKILKTFELIG